MADNLDTERHGLSGDEASNCEADTDQLQSDNAACGSAGTCNVPTFGSVRDTLVDNGYRPIPIRPGTKRPSVANWSRWDELPENLQEQHKDDYTGILTETCPTVDIDVTDQEVSFAVRQLAENMLGEGLLRIGNNPKCSLSYRAEEPFSKLKTSTFELPGTTASQAVELLCKGQQVVAFAIHPDTNIPYEWPVSSPLDMALEDLPVLTADKAREFIDACEELLRAEIVGKRGGSITHNMVAGRQAASTTSREQDPETVTPERRPERFEVRQSPEFYRNTNEIALERADQWVPNFFPQASKSSNGAWRISSASLGRDQEEDLSIHPEQGIRDFGVYDIGDAREGKRTPIDVIIEYTEAATTAHDAALALCEAMDVEPEELGYRSRIAIINEPGNLDRMVSQFDDALCSADPPLIFQRAGHLVRVATRQDTFQTALGGWEQHSDFVRELNGSDIALEITRVATVCDRDDEGGLTPRDPPARACTAFSKAVYDWNSPTLVALSEVPILGRDGAIRDKDGYDHENGLYYTGEAPELRVPDTPTQQDAKNAADRIQDVFREFPFTSDLDKSVLLTLILTLAVRNQLSTSPLFAVRSPTPGTGKGLLIDTANTLVRGKPATLTPALSGRKEDNDEEQRKRLTSLVMSGKTSLHMDNFSKPIGGDAINAFLTSPDGWSDRVLGTNEFISLPNRTVLQCSGNNLEVEGDTVRRSMVINLDANVERPELLEFERPNILEYVKQRRSELLSDVYTILRGHALAGYPHAAKTRLGSFEDWGKLTAAAVIWCGFDNPIECQKALGEKDETKGMIGRLLRAWWDVYETQEKTAGEVCTDTIDENASSGKFAALTEVIKEAFDVRGNTRSKLGAYLSKNENRIVDGLRMRVRKDKHSRVNVYSVEKVA